jgi:hypothetical protein
MLGTIAEYMSLIYEEVKGRPNFVVRETVGLPAIDGAPGRRGKR